MTKKKTFLDQIEKELTKTSPNNAREFVEYYDEIISERIDAGETEAEVIKSLGDPKTIATGAKVDGEIMIANKRPTLSNGWKALIAVLGVLALPIALPVLAVGLALFCVMLSIWVAFGATIIAVFISAFGLAAKIIWVVAAGDAPVYMLLLASGTFLLFGALAYEMGRGLIALTRHLVRWLANFLRRRNRNNQHAKGEKS